MTTEFGQSRSNRADIVQHFKSPFIVIGFFTPDYAKAAADFAANLTEHRLSHHIYERPKIEGGWSSQTRQKPGVLTVARSDYPRDILILMDVDCRVRGDIKDILNSPGDIALRTKRTAVGARHALKPCTRVMLLRPTEGSAAFVGAWQTVCELSNVRIGGVRVDAKHVRQPRALFSGHHVLRYAGMELHDAPSDAVIVHDSIRDPTRPAWAARRRLQKYFRKARDAAFRSGHGQDLRGKLSETRTRRELGERKERIVGTVPIAAVASLHLPNKPRRSASWRKTSVMKCAAWARSSMVRADGS